MTPTAEKITALVASLDAESTAKDATIHDLEEQVSALEKEKIDLTAKLAAATNLKTGKVLFDTGSNPREVIVQPGNIEAMGGETKELPAGDYTADRVEVPDGWVRDFVAPVAFRIEPGKQTTVTLLTKKSGAVVPSKPLTPPKPAYGSTDGLVEVVVAEPIKGNAKRVNEKLIAGPGVTRVFDPSPDVTHEFVNCEFDSDENPAPSAAEETTIFNPGDKPYRVIFKNCTFERRTRYGVYLDARVRNPDGTLRTPKQGEIFIYAEFHNCLVYSSDHETPTRMMHGVSVLSRNNHYEDTVDIGGDKANGAVRWHCPWFDSENDTVKGAVKIGFVRAEYPYGGRIVNLRVTGKGIWPEGRFGQVEASGITLNGQPWKWTW